MIKLASLQSNLTSTATMPIAKATRAPSLMIKRCSSSRMSRRTSSISRLVAKSASPCIGRYDGKKAFKTSEITPANIKPIIHLITARSVRMGASSCWSLISRCSLVTSSLRLISRTSDKASASASACLSGTPADLSLLANFRVSKVIAAMINSSYFNFKPVYHG